MDRIQDNSVTTANQLDMKKLMEFYGFDPISVGPDSAQYKCPIHDEEHGAALTVYHEPERGWYCYGECQSGGTVVNFMMLYEGLEYSEATRRIEEIYGIRLARASVENNEHQLLYAINTEYAERWHHALLTRPDIITHLVSERGLTQETITAWQIGFADGKRDFADEDVFRFDIVADAGIFKVNETRTDYSPFFYDRIVFPIRDNRKQIIGFTGRSIHSNSHAKWLNTRNTEIFQKRAAMLTPPDLAQRIRQFNGVVVVEGAFDAAVLNQHEIPTVAIMGLAANSTWLNTLRRHTSKIVLFLDDDDAGRSSIFRMAVKLLLPAIAADPSLNMRVAFPPNGLDPDQYAMSDANACRRTIQGATGLIDYLINTMVADAKTADSIAERLRVLSESKYADVIANLPASVRLAYIHQIAEETGVMLSIPSNAIQKIAEPPNKTVETTSTWTLDELRLADNSDDGYAGLIHNHYGQFIRFVTSRTSTSTKLGFWYVWDASQNNWVSPENHGEQKVRQMIAELRDAYANATIQHRRNAQTAVQDEMTRKVEEHRAKLALKRRDQLGSTAKKSSIVQALAEMSYRDKDGRICDEQYFDAHNNLLLTSNNRVVNLETGEVTDNQIDYRLTHSTAAAYVPDADCPEFMDFVRQITKDDPDYYDYLHRVVGYALYNHVPEKHLFLLYGPSDTGKSTFLRVLAHVLGEELTTSLASDILMTSSAGSMDRNAAIIRMGGRRMIYASESKLDQQLDSDFVKRLTGGDPLTGRGLYESPREVYVRGPVMLATNHAPFVNAHDRALINRMVVLPFDHVFRNQRDPMAEYRMYNESAGILNWAIKGALKYSAQGLPKQGQWPSVIEDATARVIDKFDPVRQFVRDVAETGNGKQFRATRKEILAAFQLWAEIEGLAHTSLVKNERNLYDCLRLQGFKDGKSGKRYFGGLRLRPEIIEELKKEAGISGNQPIPF